MQTLAAERLGYAAEHTEVSLLQVDAAGDRVIYDEVVFGPYEYDPKAAVAVHVLHRFNLSVPYVRAIFADDYQQTKHGDVAYARINAVGLLNLEGIDPALPPEPILPRRDR